MEFVGKYFMPHKGKAMLLCLFWLAMRGINIFDPNATSLLFEGLAIILSIGSFAVLAKVGWDGKGKLGWTWIESVKAAILVGLPTFLLQSIGAVFPTVAKMSVKYPDAPLFIWILGLSVGFLVSAVIFGVLINGLLGLIGHVAAKYLAPKNSQPLVSLKTNLNVKFKPILKFKPATKTAEATRKRKN